MMNRKARLTALHAPEWDSNFGGSADHIGRFHDLRRACKASLIGGMDHRKRRIGIDSSALAQKLIEADGMINHIIGAAAAATEFDHRKTQIARGNAGHLAFMIRDRPVSRWSQRAYVCRAHP